MLECRTLLSTLPTNHNIGILQVAPFNPLSVGAIAVATLGRSPTDSADGYLGLLYVVDDLKVYG